MLVIMGEDTITIDNKTLEEVIEITKEKMEKDTAVNLSTVIVTPSKIVSLLKVDNQIVPLTDGIKYDIMLIQ